MPVRRIGDWEKVTRLIGNLAYEMNKARLLSLKRFALKVEALAKGHMSKQDLPWKPLKAATVSSKIRAGYSENILIATSDYFQAITSYVKDDVAYAGVRRVVKNRSGQVLADIAAVHEYGSMSGNMPARPLWRPSFQEALTWHMKSNTPAIIFFNRIQKYYR